MLSPPRPWPVSPIAAMAGAAAVMRSQQMQGNESPEEDNVPTATTSESTSEEDPPASTTIKKPKGERRSRATFNTGLSPAHQAAFGQLLGPTGLTPIGIHTPRQGAKLPWKGKVSTVPEVDPLLVATAINLDGALDSQDVARSVKENLGIEMSLDAVAERLEDDAQMFESGAVADTMAYELTHVPPRIAYGVSPGLAVPMHRNPGRLLPSALGY